MNKTLANGRLGTNCKEIAIGGASQEIITELFEFLALKGYQVEIVDEDKKKSQPECDIVLYQIDWNRQGEIYLTPFKENGFSPELLIYVGNLPTVRILDQITGFLEGVMKI